MAAGRASTISRPAATSGRGRIERRLLGLIGGAFVVAALTAGWMLFGPAQAGGGTSYAVLVGNSMEPRLERGDLAVVRSRSSYRPGDVVLYDSRDLGAKVLHRIVRVEQGHFVLKGDNNDFFDAERPTADQILGTLWFAAPGVGGVTEWLREPLHLALFVGLATLIALGGGVGAGAAVRRGSRPVGQTGRTAPQPGRQQPLLLGTGAAAAALIALALVSFTRPLSAPETFEGAYVHQGRFSYDARVAPNAAYPQGRVETGDAVFLRLVPRLHVSFAYELESRLPLEARGRIALEARISDGNGWERALPIRAERAFASGRATVSGTLDLHQLEQVVDDVRELTGSAQAAYTVTVLPRVSVAGRLGRDHLDATFAPALAFDLGDLRLQPSAEGGGDGLGPFAPRETGTGTRVAPTQLSLGALAVPVATARRLSLLGLAALLLAGGLLLALRRGHSNAAAHELIAVRYRELLLPVASRPGGWEDFTDLLDMETLARLALHRGRMVLYLVQGAEHWYVVEDGLSLYRYRTGAPLPQPAALPALGRASVDGRP